MSSSVFAQARRGIKAKAYDAEGNEVEFDVRGDDEQQVKLDEIVDLLLAAGYFRARIKSLSPFDKVVGGLTWCLTASNEEVDVDVLFQENSTIKQKIALTEKIVAALPRMNCPYRLEPYQIQGLDFINIFPVIQWLVKKAIETRDERALEIRQSAVFAFEKTGKTPNDAEFEANKAIAATTVTTVKDAYKPRRQFKASTSTSSDEETRVYSTLLEYGRRYGASKQPKESDSKKSKKAAVAKSLEGSSEQEEDLAAIEDQRVNRLMKGMSQAGEGSISSSILGSIVGKQSAEILQLSSEYAQQQAELAAGDESRVGGAAAHKRAVSSLQKQIEMGSAALETIQGKHTELQTQYQEAQERFHKSTTYSKRIDKEMAKLDALEGDEDNQVVLKQLRALVSLNENLKKQEQQFKATCKAERDWFQGKIAKLKGEGADELDIDDERRQAIAKQYEDDLKKLQKIRLLGARRIREISALQRKIDEVPSRAELTQYQRRFVELYQQVAAKLRETKQYYTLYNTLDDTKLYMQKEVTLLNSIHENFEAAMSSAANKEQFMQQFAQIVAGVKGNLDKVDQKQSREKLDRDKLSDVHLDLVEKERQYYKTVKDYETECAKNELCLAKLKKKQSKA